jgi:ribosomal protein S18 acetylase RimI-like enzyme
MKPIIRTMTSIDCDRVVCIHLDAFKGFFLSFLGSRFLSAFYHAVIGDSSGITLIIENEGRMTGFVFGTTQPAGLYSRLLRRKWLQFAWAAFPAFLHHPAILPRLLRAFSTPKQKLPAENCATLMSIAVAPTSQGQGIGKLLAQAFIDEARARGSQYVNLTTDAVNNDAANYFYQSLGFHQVRKFTTPEGRIMNEYLISVS